MRVQRSAIALTLSISLLFTGVARADLLIGNLDAPDATVSPTALRIGGSTHPTVSKGIFSVSFTTPSVPYYFENLKLRINQRADTPTADPFVSIWTDSGAGVPDQLVVRLEEDRPLTPGNDTYVFTAPTPLTLNPDTLYYVVVSNANNSVYGWIYSSPWTNPTGAATFESVRSFNSIVQVWGPPIPPRPKLEVNAIPDDDGDGVPNDIDFCPNSILTESVIIDGQDTGIANPVFEDGCTIADLVQMRAEEATNHGQFVRSITKLAKSLESNGSISSSDRSVLVSTAAQSSIGKG